jgi:ribonuclease HI
VKALKFDHDLAKLILEGKKTSTWRLFDDKDLSVNDEVKVIDKVDPTRPETWEVIGTARINEVIQKTLGQVGASEYEGREKFSSQAEMVRAYKEHYGENVNLRTVVKIIRFDFNNNSHKKVGAIEVRPQGLTEVKLYVDGGSRGNPGPSASGLAVLDMNDRIVVKKGIYLGITTNNQAEYQALKSGLEEVSRMGVKEVHVYMDSLLVVNQMRGSFKVRNRDLWPIHNSIKDLARQFAKITYTHVPRAMNKIADSAVNEALDEASKN